MNKKIILFLLSLAFIMPCIFLLSACGEQETKGTQTSSLVIENVYQNSYGSVFIEFENANQYIDEVTSTIEISCDNGTTWIDYFYDNDDLNTGLILYFNELNNNYYNTNATYPVGFELDIIARLKENDLEFASNSTAVYNYALKSVVPDKHFGFNLNGLTGTVVRESYAITEEGNIYYDERFEFFNNNQIEIVDYVLYLENNAIKMGTVVINENNYTITPYNDCENFEFRFFDGTTILSEDMNSYDTHNHDSEGWTTIPQAGIAYTLNDTYEQDEMTLLDVLIRQKETFNSCFSACDLIRFNLI